ncbi:MAG TPA: hypothetical protein VGO61_03655 [Steroidobacteraceae bacterium]|jgi:hypothetical protein|nr:hypothetical protein [Steroidobacteraceae bacterium]
MPDKEQLTWNLALQITGGPVVAAGDSLAIGGYEKYRVIIADGASGVARIGDAGGVQFVALVPGTPHESLTYKVGAEDIKLDRAQVFAGEGAVSFIEDAFPEFTFDNDTGAEAVIDVLVARL